MFWPIVWFSLMLAAVVSFVVILFRENAQRRTAAAALKPQGLDDPGLDAVPSETGENFESFPTENFDFDDGTKS